MERDFTKKMDALDLVITALKAHEKHLDGLIRRLERKEKRTIVVEVFQGCVQEVRNLPEGWNYKVIDNDT